VIGFNVVYQQFEYDSGCQIYCNWSRLKPGFKVPAHLSTIAADKLGTTPSHFKMILDEPVQI